MALILNSAKQNCNNIKLLQCFVGSKKRKTHGWFLQNHVMSLLYLPTCFYPFYLSKLYQVYPQRKKLTTHVVPQSYLFSQDMSLPSLPGITPDTSSCTINPDDSCWQWDPLIRRMPCLYQTEIKESLKIVSRTIQVIKEWSFS